MSSELSESTHWEKLLQNNWYINQNCWQATANRTQTVVAANHATWLYTTICARRSMKNDARSTIQMPFQASRYPNLAAVACMRFEWLSASIVIFSEPCPWYCRFGKPSGKAGEWLEPLARYSRGLSRSSISGSPAMSPCLN